jgi:subfamily B ATP-binding cassette protein MsbA
MKGSTTITRLLPLLRSHRWGFPAIVLVGLLQSLSEGIGIGLFIPLLTGVVTGGVSQGRGQWLVTTMEGLFRHVAPDRRLAVIILCVFVAVVVTALLSYLHHILFGWLDGNISHTLRRRIFGQLMAVSFDSIGRAANPRR